MTKPRVLVCQPILPSLGGAHAVAAWTLEALRDDFSVGLCTLSPVNLDALNRAFGTSLRPGDFELCLAPARYAAALRHIPTAGALLEMSLTIRWALELDRRSRYALLFSTSNEAGFGRPGIQYVHFPWAYLPRPEVEVRWFHRIPGLLSGYREACLWLARGSWHELRRNLTVANSEFTAQRIREVHGIESAVVYPPAPGEFLLTSWEQRPLAAAGVGRLHPCKRWEMAVDIVERVRHRGHLLTLTLFGHPDGDEYGRRLDELARTRPWFRIERSLSREDLGAALARHRYGIHTMHEEHFGMAPAELQRAGCIPFVHNSGGAVEIVARDPRLVFDDAPDAAEKIAMTIQQPALEQQLREQATARQERFSPERFCRAIRELVWGQLRRS